MKVKIGDSKSKFVFGWAMIGSIIHKGNIFDKQVTAAREMLKDH